MAVYTMQQLKDYIKGGEERKLVEGLVLLDVTYNLLERRSVDIPFELHAPISKIKDKVYNLCGASPSWMTLLLNNTTPLDNDNATLAHYGAKTGMFLHCIDNDPHSNAKHGGLEDVSQVKKYVMSDEDYEKRAGTFRDFKKQQLQKDPNWVPIWEQKARDAQKAKLAAEVGDAETPAATLERVKVGMRCECWPGGRRGEVMFVGPVPELAGAPAPAADGEAAAAPAEDPVWIGVKFDEPVGKGNGSVGGKSYFQAEPKHGAFIKPQLCKVGDYPEEDPFADSDAEKDEKEAAPAPAAAAGENVFEEL